MWKIGITNKQEERRREKRKGGEKGRERKIIKERGKKLCYKIFIYKVVDAGKLGFFVFVFGFIFVLVLFCFAGKEV